LPHSCLSSVAFRKRLLGASAAPTTAKVTGGNYTMFMNKVAQFAMDENGAVTVDWVVLTAALVGLGLAVMNVVGSGLDNLANDIRVQLERDHINTSFD
jgi:Flp pilus assembly pilin Flp